MQLYSDTTSFQPLTPALELLRYAQNPWTFTNGETGSPGELVSTASSLTHGGWEPVNSCFLLYLAAGLRRLSGGLFLSLLLLLSPAH